MASANAIPINIAGKILAEASGFRPIASMALKPMRPTPSAGNIPPMAITAPFAKTISVKFCSPPQWSEFFWRNQLKFAILCSY